MPASLSTDANSILIHARYSMQELINELDRNDNPDLRVIGFCVRRNANLTQLYFDKVFLNPSADTTTRSGILQITPPAGDTLTINRSSQSLDLNQAMMDAYLNRQVEKQVDGKLLLIPEFEFVYINADILRHFAFLNSRSPEERMLYISNAVATFFLDDGQMGTYRTLKFSPFEHFTPSDSNVATPTAYYLGPSCPPIWKEMIVETVSISGQNLGARGGQCITIPLMLSDFLMAYQKAGIQIAKKKKSPILKTSKVKGLTDEKIGIIETWILKG